MRLTARATAPASSPATAPVVSARAAGTAHRPAGPLARIARAGSLLLLSGAVLLSACGGGEEAPATAGATAPPHTSAEGAAAATATGSAATAPAGSAAAAPAGSAATAPAGSAAAAPTGSAAAAATGSAAAATPAPGPGEAAGAPAGEAGATATPEPERVAQPPIPGLREITGASLPDKPGGDDATEGGTGASATPGVAQGAIIAALREAFSGDGAVYTWQDGPHTRQVRLVSGLVAQATANTGDDDLVVAAVGDEAIVIRGTGHDSTNSSPVFTSGGELMTLPGGVLLAFDPEWDEYRINILFSHNGIKLDRVSPRSFSQNAYFVETEPGMPSLELANTLASQEGVRISIPNWGRQLSLR